MYAHLSPDIAVAGNAAYGVVSVEQEYELVSP